MHRTFFTTEDTEEHGGGTSQCAPLYPPRPGGDLRRTAATFMAASGEMDEVIDAVLSHSNQGIIRVYNQFKYDAQKQAALEAWGRRVERIAATAYWQGHQASG